MTTNKLPRRALPSQVRLSELLVYTPETGALIRKVAVSGGPKGAEVGWVSSDGYLGASIDRSKYAVDALIFKLVTGTDPRGPILHMNGNKLDNRWENLREPLPVTRFSGLPTREYLWERLHYDPKTGEITLKFPRNRLEKAGDPACFPGTRGDLRLTVDGKGYTAHIIAYRMMTGLEPSLPIKHLDNDLTNNTWSNLILAAKGKPPKVTNPVKRHKLPSQRELRAMFDYDPVDGILSHKGSTEPAGFIEALGYRAIRINGKTFKVHRLVWKWITGEDPKEVLDHVNRDKLDNRFSNLRSVSQRDNCRNGSIRSNNKSGVSGVSFDKSSGKWQTTINGERGQRRIGRYATFEEAVAARVAAEIEHGYHEQHGRPVPTED